jgi:hypothetical protein
MMMAQDDLDAMELLLVSLMMMQQLLITRAVTGRDKQG